MSAAEQRRRPRLMIADDDAIVRSVLSMWLASDFDIVGVAADGEEAIELAAASQPDAALVDVEMPKGGGLAAVRGIVAVAAAAAIVVLADECDGPVRELIEAGAIAYCPKGAAPEALVDSVIESIAVRASQRAGVSQAERGSRAGSSHGSDAAIPSPRPRSRRHDVRSNGGMAGR